MSKGRDLNVTGIIIGRKGTGKSTYLAELAKKYPPHLKVLVFDVNGSPAYNSFLEITIDQVKRLKTGIVKIKGTPTPAMLTQLAKDFRNGLVVFEDCTKYIEGNIPPAIKTFLVDHRMYNCDLIFTFHSIKRVPPFFWEMVSYVTLLKTLEVLDTGQNKNRIPNFQNLLNAFNEVNAHPSPYYSKTIATFV